MNLWPRRARPTVPPAPRANPTRIAVLEHDLLGIPPQPGSAAAVAIALRRSGTCIQHQPVNVGTFSVPLGTGVLCVGCGNHLTPTTDGGWRIADTRNGEQ